MKDAFGHGSNAKLTQTHGPASPMPRGPTGKGSGEHSSGGIAVTSNAQAAQALMSVLKSTQAPIHPAMALRSSPDGGSAS